MIACSRAAAHRSPSSIGTPWQPPSCPRTGRDPFDRLLVAQAREEHAVLVTGDRAFATYDVAVRRPG